MSFGSLDIVLDENDVRMFEIKSDYEVELMIKRIIPSHRNFPLRIRVQPENTALIRMIMREYPLNIKTDKWKDCLAEIEKKKKLAKSIQTLTYKEPSKSFFLGKLLPFQKQGLDFIQKTDGNTLITDEMGLGKTVESLAYVSLKSDLMPVVVVSPLVTLMNWKREIHKFLALVDTPLDGQEKMFDGWKRQPVVNIIRHGIVKDQPHDLKPADFFVINYELLSKRLPDILAMEPKGVIFDEIHNLRNEVTRKYEACQALSRYHSIQYRLGLSGTPIYNKGVEMYNICEIIKSGVLGERSEFIRRYCMNWNPTQSTDEGKKGLADVLRNTIMIRRKKIDVLKDLPEKIRMKQTIPIDTVYYEEQIQKLYDKINIAKEDMANLITDESKKEGLFELNKRIREMRVAERQIAGLAKAPHVVDYLNNLLSDYEEEKFVVFCHHRAVHQVIFDGLFRYNPVQVIGGQSDDQRQGAIDTFQDPESDTRVIICGLRAGSLGISLTTSAYVIFAELDWTPSVHRQAEDRLHRIGQKKSVFAHYLEGEGTFDEIISQILLKKTVEITGILGDKMESMDNQKALEFLKSRYDLEKPSEIAQHITTQIENQ